MEAERVWERCADGLQGELSAEQFNTCIRPLQATGDKNNVCLLAPNRYIKERVNEEFIGRIREELRKHAGHASVNVDVGDVCGTPSSESAARQSSSSEAAPESFVQPPPDLRKEFTFDTFVEGQSNDMARAAAMQASESVGGSAPGPLLLYGGTGLGKTHLMHAVGNAIVERHPHLKVVYVYAQGFLEGVVGAIRAGTMPDFTNYYRSVDVLLMDDIQFLVRGQRTQEEFFHVFNRLQEKGRQIVLTSDRFPKEIEGLEDRLKSRLIWGMTALVEPPELETRVAILLKKAEQAEADLPREAALTIAEQIRSNVRELEGALQRVIARARLSGTTITRDLVYESLRDVVAVQARQVGMDNIQKCVANYYRIRVSDLLSRRRTRNLARPRQLAMALARDLTNHSYPEIGEAFGGKDHTTVLHACRRIEELRESDRQIREEYNNLLRILTG